MLLIIAGYLFTLIWIINSALTSLRGKAKISFWGLALAFLIALLPVAGLVSIEGQAVTDFEPRFWVLALAVLISAPSSIIALIELRRPERLRGSRGILGVMIGGLLAVSAFTVPLTAVLIRAQVPPTATFGVVRPTLAGVAVSTDGATLAPTASATPSRTPSATPSRTPRPTDTPAPTRYSFVTSTPTPTATLPNPCLALALYNINLRAEPDSNAALIVTIPFDTTLTVFGRDADSLWWFTEYEGQGGWVKGEFIQTSAACAKLPVRR